MRNIIILLSLTASINLMAQNQFINPKPVGYSDAVVTTTGKTIYVSGQVPVDRDGKTVGRGDLKMQTIQVFDNIGKVLAQSGANFSNVVKINTYIVNCRPQDVAVVRDVRKSYLSQKEPPASTLVGVTSLVDPDFLIEIEVVAVVD